MTHLKQKVEFWRKIEEKPQGGFPPRIDRG